MRSRGVSISLGLVRRTCRSQSTRQKGTTVSATVLYMSMSLDGFIAGPNEGPGNGLGDGGHRLHEWYFEGGDDGVNRKVKDESLATGAIVAGRGTFEPAEGWGGDRLRLGNRPRQDKSDIFGRPAKAWTRGSHEAAPV